MRHLFRVGLVIGLGFTTACVGPKPCASGGDVTWKPQVKGDRTCRQTLNEEGRWVNHGKFIQYDLVHKIRVEGMFKLGEKHGIWVEYDDTGKRKREVYFEEGVEKPVVIKKDEEDHSKREVKSNS